MNRSSFLWIAPFTLFILGYLLPALLLRVERVSTPSLVGKDLCCALAALSDANLNMRLIGQKEDHDLPAGTIISQTPRAGHAVRPNQSVFLVISTQPPRTILPDLVGMQELQAKHSLSSLGIRSKLFSVPSSYPTGTCIGQAPPSQAPAGDEPLLAYCAQHATRPIIWPDFVGKSLQAVVDFLAYHHLEARVSREKTRSGKSFFEESLVTDQRPLAGSLLKLDPKHLPVVQLQAT